MSTNVSIEQYHHICQFYYYEARLLDERRFQQWLELMAEDIRYTVPARCSPMPDSKQRGNEAILDTGQEFSQGLEPPLRDDDYFTLSIRVMRSFKSNSWSDNPMLRTSRFVSNIEVIAEDDNAFTVYSNVMLSASRYGRDNAIYTMRRKDLIRSREDSFNIAERTVMLDWNVITAPSVGLFF